MLGFCRKLQCEGVAESRKRKEEDKMRGREGSIASGLSNPYGSHVVANIYDGAIGIHCLKPKNWYDELFKISV